MRRIAAIGWWPSRNSRYRARMDNSSSALWLAEAARLTNSARALAALGDLYELAHVRGLNDALEARTVAMTTPAPDVMDYFMLAPCDCDAGYTPAVPEAVRARYTLRPVLPEPIDTAPPPHADAAGILSPIRFDTPLTLASPVAPRGYDSDLRWYINAGHVEQLEIALRDIARPWPSAAQRTVDAIWAVSRGLSTSAAATKFSIARSKINTCMRDLQRGNPEAAARRICKR